MVFKVIWLFVTGAGEGLVTDVVISCVVPWETEMQPRNDDDFVVCLRREVAQPKLEKTYLIHYS